MSQTQLGLFNESLQEFCLSVSSLITKNGYEILCVIDHNITEAEFTDYLIKRIPANDVGLIKIDQFEIKKLDENVNWLAQSYEALPAFEIEDFFVYGSHYEGDIPEDKIPLLIDAATAFGSGSHGTTAGCLKALLSLKNEGFTPETILDLGAGAGILSIAAHKLWPSAKILATDIDPESIIVTNNHVRINKANNIDVIESDGFKKIDPALSFDLTIANILAMPLRILSEDIMLHTNVTGHIILSGLLIEQEDDIKSHYDNVTLQKNYHIDEWSTLIFFKD